MYSSKSPDSGTMRYSPTMDALESGLKLSTGQRHMVKVPRISDSLVPLVSATSTDAFESWPTMTGKLPATILERVKNARAAIPMLDEKALYSNGNGYAYNGRFAAPSELFAPEDESDDNPQRRAKFKQVLERFATVELRGEGGMSAVMTGDGAKFTWGPGLTGDTLVSAFASFLNNTPAAKTDLLECGISIHGGSWKIVDLDRGEVKSGSDALDFLNGIDPKGSDVRRRLLSAIVAATNANLTQAANAQWPSIKKNHVYPTSFKPPKAVLEDARWDAGSICYVLHCGYWGTFPGWEEFKKTNGDLKKILRLEAEFTYARNNGSVLLVKQKDQNPNGSPIYPATTMLFNFGGGLVQEKHLLAPLNNLSEASDGDVVFEIAKPYRNTYNADYAALRGVPRQFDLSGECIPWFDQHHFLSMKELLAACDDLSKKNKLRLYRNWYDSGPNPGREGNPQFNRWGLRPRVAMDTVLLRKRDATVKAKILDDARSAGISETQCQDQFALIKSRLGMA